MIDVRALPSTHVWPWEAAQSHHGGEWAADKEVKPYQQLDAAPPATLAAPSGEAKLSHGFLSSLIKVSGVREAALFNSDSHNTAPRLVFFFLFFLVVSFFVFFLFLFFFL